MGSPANSPRHANGQAPARSRGWPYSYGQAASFKFNKRRPIISAFYHDMIISIARPVAGLFVVYGIVEEAPAATG
jgi:hypothetical protein